MFDRPMYLEKLKSFKDTDFIKVITGVRRSGKSVILKLYSEYLKSLGISEENIIYINFELFEYQSIKNEHDFHELISSLNLKTDVKYYFLFDEIQFVDGWQKVINSLRISFDVDIVITGSNANMLSGELATFLSGRYVEIPVHPFSFKEFLYVKGIDLNSRYVDTAYSEYEIYGGFPSVVIAEKAIKDTVLSGIFDSIVLNDVAFRSGIKDTEILKGIINFLADNVGQIVNPTKISNVFKNERLSVSNHTVSRYLELLENAFLFSKARQYDVRGKEYLRSNNKYFIVDNGLRRISVGMRGGNYSNRLENIVYTELVRRGYRVDVGRIDSKEIDFIAKKMDEVLYVQVSYELPNNKHETDNLLLVNDNYRKIVVTGKYYEEKIIDGIEIVYIVDWLLED